MNAPTKHALGQLGHLDLVALAIEASAAPSDELTLHLGSRSRDQLIDALTRPATSARLAERAGTRLTP